MVWNPAAEATINDFLETLRAAGMRFDYVVRQPAPATLPLATVDDGEPLDLSAATASAPVPASNSAAAPTMPQLHIDFSGPDAALMIERGGELLHAMESLAAGILRLEPEQNDQISFDALGFKGDRQAATERTAQQGIDAVSTTGKPFVFPPMNSRERRMLHLVLATSGFPTASSGDGPRRFVVVYPLGVTPTPERFDPPPVRRAGSAGRPSFGGGRASGRKPGGRFAQAPARTAPEPPPVPRLDPNGNPLEYLQPAESTVTTSEEERLASLRRAFRKR